MPEGEDVPAKAHRALEPLETLQAPVFRMSFARNRCARSADTLFLIIFRKFRTENLYAL